MFVAFAALTWPARAGAQQTLTIATLAPRNSPWMRVFTRWGDQVRRASRDTLRLRFITADAALREEDTARRLRARDGGLHGAAMTAAGLSQFDRTAMLFQIPEMYQDGAAVEAALVAVRGELEERLRRTGGPEDRGPGLEVLAWAHVGTMYAFSDHPVRTHAEVVASRPWGWTIDRVSNALHQVVGTRAVSMPVGAVAEALRLHRVNLVLGTSLSALSLGWWPWVRFSTDRAIAHVVGAVVLRRDVYARLPLEQQQILTRTAEAMASEFRGAMLGLDDRSRVAMSARGLAVVRLDDAQQAEWTYFLTQARRMLIGSGDDAVADCTLVLRVVDALRSPPQVRAAWRRECEERPAPGTLPAVPLLRAPLR